MPNPSFALSNGGASTDNPTPARNLYPTSPGATLGQASGAQSMSTTGRPVGDQVGAAGGNGGMVGDGIFGQPLSWFVALIALFIVLGMVAKRAGNAGEFGNIKASAYNIMTITFAAIIGIAGLKVVLTRFPVPGLSAVVLAV